MFRVSLTRLSVLRSHLARSTATIVLPQQQQEQYQRVVVGLQSRSLSNTVAGDGFDIKSNILGKGATVFSKSFCPFCYKTKRTLEDLGIDYSAFEMEGGDSIQQQLTEITKQRTVPNIFINENFRGGNSDLDKAKNDGTLTKMLEK